MRNAAIGVSSKLGVIPFLTAHHQAKAETNKVTTGNAVKSHTAFRVMPYSLAYRAVAGLQLHA